jgi:ribonuclease BN (tRNA processing enzyme)
MARIIRLSRWRNGAALADTTRALAESPLAQRQPGDFRVPREEGTLLARFWGVRGSHPVAYPTGSRFGVNTTCLELRYGRHVLIFDAGTGIVGLGDALAREWKEQPAAARPTLNVLFTHAHHDHLCGLPFFAPLFQSDAAIHMLGPDLAGMAFVDIIAGYMRSPYFPVDFRDLPSRRFLRTIGDGMRIVWLRDADGPVPWDVMRPTPPDALAVDVMYSQMHPREGTLIYRVTAGGNSLVFATDVEVGERGDAAEQRFIRFVRGADVLVHDSQYSEEDYAGNVPHRGYGHSTPAMAAKIARAGEVGRLVLFHHDPTYADADVAALEHAARHYFPETIAAREGLEILLDGDGQRDGEEPEF